MLLSIMSLTLAALAPQQTITLNAPAQTLDHLMVKLGQACGKPLAVSSALANEVVTINVKDADSEEVLKRLAKVAGGVWVNSSDGQRLDKDMSLEAAEKQQALEERTAFLKAEIAKQVAELNKQPVFDPKKLQEDMQTQRDQSKPGPGGRAFGPPSSLMPGTRAIIQSLASMRPEDLARIAIGQRVVYTTSPTQMQRALPGNSVNVMRTFVNDQVKMFDAFGNMGGTGGAIRQKVAEQRATTGNQARTQAPPQVPAKAFLIVTRMGGGDAINFNYIVADNDGRTIGNGMLTLGQDFMRTAPVAETAKDPAETTITLSENAKSALQAFSRGGFRGGDFVFTRGGGGGGVVTVTSVGTPEAAQTASPKLADLLRDPVTNDPLSLHVTEALDATAQGKNFVALLPDSLALTMGQFLSTAKSGPQVLAAAKDKWRLEVEESDGWLTIAPKRRLDARLERVDRKALKVLIDATIKKGSARLDDVAAYATKAPQVSFGGVDTAVMRIVDPASAQALNAVYGMNRDMLLLYASMGQATRMGLARGQKMSVPSVASNGMALTADMVYNSPDGPSVLRQDANNPRQGAGIGQSGGVATSPQQAVAAKRVADIALDVSATMGSQFVFRGGPGGGGFGTAMMMGGQGDMTAERTEVLPRGVPGGSLLSMTTTTEMVAKAVRKNAGLARTYTAMSLGNERALSEVSDPNGRRIQPDTVAWDGYLQGSKATYAFVFELAPGITLYRSLDDTEFSANGTLTGYDQLPKDFRDRVNQQYQSTKDNYSQKMNRFATEGQRAQGRRGGGTKPPL